MILLDTNAVIAIINRRPEVVRKRFTEHQAAGALLAISSIVVFELRFGVANSPRRNFNAQLLDGFLAGLSSVLDFDSTDADAAGAIRADLAKRGTPIGPYDVLIAGQALRHGATLVTANTAEFSRVAGLAVENWAA